MEKEKEIKPESVGQPDKVAEPTVSKKEYDDLYKQAIQLQTRYTRLLELFNVIIDKYLTAER